MNTKNAMSEEEIEAEVQERVKFKMNELMTGVKNRAQMNWCIAFQQMSQKHTHYWEAFGQLQEMIKKEIHMATPRSDMYHHKMSKEALAIRNIKNKAIDRIITRIRNLPRYDERALFDLQRYINSEIEKITEFRR